MLDVLSRPADLLAVEVSSFQLFWAPSLRPEAGAVLNIAEDHLDWHGGFEAYAAAKARALDGRVAVVGLDDAPGARAAARIAGAPVKAGFRLGEPAAGELGVRDGMLVDRAFADDLVLAPADSHSASPVRSGCSTRSGAAALARAVDVAAGAIAAGSGRLPGGPAPRRSRRRRSTGCSYVDDSKATNPHAAEASILAYPRVVWVAGGMLKGASVDDTVAQVADRLAGAVLIGRDRAAFAKALSRHAPDVPVIEVVTREDAGVHETNESGVTDGTRVVDASGPGLGRRVMAEAVAGRSRPGAPRRHGAAGPGRCVVRPVHRLCRPW